MRYLGLTTFLVFCIIVQLFAQPNTKIDASEKKSAAQSNLFYKRHAKSLTPLDISDERCGNFQTGYVANSVEELIDIVASNGKIFTAGHIKNGASTDITVGKLLENGKLEWSFQIGGTGNESIRKIIGSGDGGILLIGQSSSNQRTGAIFCAKVNSAGKVVWQRQFGLGSANGDLGMDIILTADGGYALTGIIDVMGGVADMVVIKLNADANLVWAKRFDKGDGEDGVGLLQQGSDLLVTADLQRGLGHYEFAITRLKLSDGSFVSGKKYSPAVSGLFNPYIVRKPDNSGFFISGHTINNSSYGTMQHTVLSLDNALTLQNTQQILVHPQSNNFYTGFIPMADGSFIGCASPQDESGGYYYRVMPDNTVMYGVRFDGTQQLNPNRIASHGTSVLMAGVTTTDVGQTGGFVASLPTDGDFKKMCNLKKVTASVTNPAFDEDAFAWSNISSPVFTGINVSLPIRPLTIDETNLCPQPTDFDFTSTVNICDPREVQFSTQLTAGRSFEWEFGNGVIEPNKQVITTRFTNGSVAIARLTVVNGNGCMSTLEKKILLDLKYDRTSLLQSDTSLCAGDSLRLNTTADIFCWSGSPQMGKERGQVIKPVQSTTYGLNIIKKGTNLFRNSNFETGNNEFLSDFQFSSQSLPGSYFVGKKGKDWNSNLPTCPDNSGSLGNMLLISSGREKKKVWSQLVNLQPQTNYLIEAWIQKLSNSGSAELTLYINGAQVGTAFSATSNSCIWQRERIFWNSGTLDRATISIVDNGSLASSFIYGLDDLYFGAIEYQADSLKVSVNQPTPFTLKDSAFFCPGKPVQIEAAPSEAGSTIAWSGIETIDVTNPWRPLVTAITPIKLYATATTRNGCTLKDSIFLLKGFMPSVIVMPDTALCMGTVFNLQATVGNATAVKWQPSQLVSNPEALTPVTTIQNDSWFTLEATSKDGCSSKDSIFIRAISQPTIEATKDTLVCVGTTIQLSAAGGNKYEWLPATAVSDPQSDTTYITALKSAQYQVKVTDVAGCTALHSIQVTVTEKPVFEISTSNDKICVGDSITLIASGGTSYKWIHDQKEQTTGLRVLHPNEGVNKYDVAINHKICRQTDTLSVTVIGNAPPKGSIAPHGSIDCNQINVRLQANGGERYEWSPANGLSQTNIPNPIAMPGETTNYRVKIYADNGCAKEVSTTVKVLTTGKRTFHLPNSFTPNGDGLNDCFGPKNWGNVDNYSLMIFNRWGQMIFQTNNTTDCWDGRFKYTMQPNGVYVYQIKGKAACGEVAQTGFVTIIR